MPKFRLQGRQDRTRLDGADSAAGFLPNSSAVAFADEAERQFKDYGAHTYEDLYVNVTTHGGGFNLVISETENGTTSTNLTMTATGTGIIRDGTGTEAATANDLIAIEHINDGMHGDHHTTSQQGIVASAGVAGIVGGGILGDNATIAKYIGLWSEQDDTVAADVITRLSRDVTVNNLRVYLTAQAGTTPFAAFEVTAGASSNVTLSATATGATEDVTGSEAYSSGDDVGVRYLGSSGNTGTTSVVQMDTDVDEVALGGMDATEQFGTTDRFAPLVNGRLLSSTSDTSGVTKHDTRIGVEDIANLHVFIQAVSSPTTARFGPKLNADAVSTNVVVAPSASGLISDETGVETLAEADEVGFFGDTASGTFDVTSAYIEMPSTVVGPPVTQPYYHRVGGVPWVNYGGGGSYNFGRTW